MATKTRKGEKKMRLKSWVKWFLFDWMLCDIMLVLLYLYALRIIEIGG